MTVGLDRIMGNEAQIKHVLLSLFNKALQSLTGGGELTVAARNHTNRIEIVIRKGPVVQPFQLPALASRTPDFTTAESSLSLNVCFNIIRHHKGVLWVHCRSGDDFMCALQFPILLT